MSLGMNILWLVLGGFVAGLGWYLTGVVAAVSVVGLPWARACFTLGNFTLAPFGRDVVDRKTLTGRGDLGTGTAGALGNVVWLVFAGWWLALLHLAVAVATAVTVIGIPFAIQHVKLAGASVFPVGKAVVAKGVAAFAQWDRDEEEFARRRGRRYTLRGQE